LQVDTVIVSSFPLSSYIDRLRTVFDNPVFVHELRVAWRGWRAPVWVTASVAAAVAAFVWVIRWHWPHVVSIEVIPTVYPIMGRSLFLAVMMAEALLGTLLAPGLAAGAFARERRQDGLDSLLATRLSTHAILLGKLAAVGCLLLLIPLSAVPVAAIITLFGGVSPSDLCWSLLLILSTLSLQCALGVYLALRVPRVTPAMGLSYALYLLWLLGSSLILGILYAYHQLFVITWVTFVASLLLSATFPGRGAFTFWRRFSLFWGVGMALLLCGALVTSGLPHDLPTLATLFTLAHPAMMLNLTLTVSESNVAAMGFTLLCAQLLMAVLWYRAAWRLLAAQRRDARVLPARAPARRRRR